MHRLVTSALLFILLSVSAFATVVDPVTHKRRPTVAVVLAGGGAKGMAHITALKAIEEAGIPIDIVVGNSIGSLIGGLYSVGYDADELRKHVTSQDWMALILDNPSYGMEGLDVRRDNEKYVLQMSLGSSQWNVARMSGILQGKNVISLMKNQLMRGLSDSIDFNTLPRRFACVATEAQSGKVYEFHSGDIVQAMRASMAIPGAFTPVKKDTLVFVDGGITNNFPVDVARGMGADIVIGLDLSTGVSTAQLMENFADIMTHLYDVTAAPLYKKNIADCDLYIPLDVSGYSAASFSPAAIDTLLHRGETSIEPYRDSLRLLKQNALHLPADYRPKPTATVPGMTYSGREGDTRSRFKSINRAIQKTVIKVGARFDNYEHASVLLGAYIPIHKKLRVATDVTVRLGNRLDIEAFVHHPLFGFENFNFGYRFHRCDQELYFQGIKAGKLLNVQNRFQMHIGQTWHDIDYKIGIRWESWNNSDILVRPDYAAPFDSASAAKNERFFTYFIEGEYNSLNSSYFPTRGTRIQFGAHLYSTNLYRFHDKTIVPEADVFFQKAIPVGARLTILPQLQARFVFFEDSTPLCLANIVGGFQRGLFYDQQMTMAGIFYPEFSHDFAINAGLRVQQQLWASSHYLHVAADVGAYAPHLKDLLKSQYETWGFQFGYAYRFMAGPLSATGYWSQMTKEFAFLINLGYVF